MSKVLITQDLFNNINYDMDKLKVNNTTATIAEPSQPTLMVIFANSDINAAIHHLLKSLETPFEQKAIASVLVQESIKQDFVQKLQSQLKPYDNEDILKNGKFVKALETIKKLSAQVITVKGSDKIGPTLVYDFTHEQFGNQVTGVVTLHHFRTAKEAASLVGKESLKFSSVSIWHENHTYAYELIAALKSEKFFINCYHQTTTPLDSLEQGKCFVTMDKNYHYETMPHDGIQKSIVFPIGSIFAN